MKNILVLGAGMVGSAMAIDLAINHRVTLSDKNAGRLSAVSLKCSSLALLQLDVTDTSELIKAMQPFDLIVCAVPGYLGYKTVQTAIGSGKNIVDISFFPENSLELDSLAREKNVTAIVDCGVAPGMHNLFLGYFNEKYRITDFECMVGGLPTERKWPFYYKAPFSPVDVIEEYTRPARYIENGKLLVREPLTDCELVEFERVGTLEAFNSDGLRTIIDTMPHIRNMKEKTLRYPGHVEYVRVLKESGFFSTQKIRLGDCEVSPLDFTSRILFSEWKLGETERELTVMRVTLKGSDHEGEPVKITCNLYDEYCSATQTSSMARTTGYTATAAANMFLEGVFTNKGIFPPELFGNEEKCFNYILDYLKERNVCYRIDIQKINS